MDQIDNKKLIVSYKGKIVRYKGKILTPTKEFLNKNKTT
jgi:hypothetical protein